MTPHQILIVGLRVLVIFWSISVLGQAGAILTAIQDMDVPANAFLISLGLQLIAIVALQ